MFSSLGSGSIIGSKVGSGSFICELKLSGLAIITSGISTVNNMKSGEIYSFFTISPSFRTDFSCRHL